MKALAALSIVTLLLVAGCSNPAFYWYHPARTIAEATADFNECREQACHKAADMITDEHYDRVPPSQDPSSSRGLPRDQAQRETDPRDTQRAWRERYEQGVVADGMRQKGYLKLRADRIPPDVHTRQLSHGGAVAGR